MISLIPNPKKMAVSQGFLSVKNIDKVEFVNTNIISEHGTQNAYYSLQINKDGVFYSGDLNSAKSTVKQLFYTQNNNSLPFVKIEDWSEFNYRGALLDVSRHFILKDDIIKFIKTISLFKINKFQFHLTDDNGWRIQIDKYPKLTQMGSSMGSKGILHNNGWANYSHHNDGFYTKNDIMEIVKVANDCGVQIIPEIDIPGHSLAAITAYSELAVSYLEDKNFKVKKSKPNDLQDEVLNMLPPTVDFFKNVFDEVLELIPTDKIALGGDECPKNKVNESAIIKKYMSRNNIKTADDLQIYFMSQIVDFLYSKGVKSYCWDEIIDANELLDRKKVVVDVWRNQENIQRSLDKGYTIMCCPYNPWYLDLSQNTDEKIMHHQGINTLKDVYNFVPPIVAIGGQGNIWTELLYTLKDVEDATFPRLCAIAEVLWNGNNKLPYNDFVKNLQPVQNMLKNLKVNTRI